MNETWENTRRDLEAAVRASMSMQEKAYFMSTLALMNIAAALQEIVKSMPNPLDVPE